MPRTAPKHKAPPPLPRPAAPPPPRLAAGAHNGRPLTEHALHVLAQIEALFKAEGFAHLTAQDLASRLRCSRRMLYQLAPSLDELAALVVDGFFQRMGRTCIAAASVGVTRAAQLDAYMRTAITDWADANPSFNRDMQALPVTKRLVDAHFAFGATYIEALLALGVDEGEFAPVHPPLAAQVFLASGLTILDPDLLRRADLDVARAIDELVDLLINGVCLR
jgi:AcrR family transcriptional regulator